MSSSCLILFTKPARPGQVKTRLIGELTAQQTALLHAAFIGDVVERLRQGSFELRLAWALEAGESEPPLAEPPLAELPLAGLSHLRQEGATLGDRLYAALALAARSFSKVAAVGSDHPTLSLARVEEAFAVLERSDVVLGPAVDGGYYLIGVRGRALSPRLFAEVPWSTDRVLSTTLERCDQLGLEARLLPPGRDVDTPEDLEPLVQSLRSDQISCPRTAALLAGWGLLGATPSQPRAVPG